MIFSCALAHQNEGTCKCLSNFSRKHSDLVYGFSKMKVIGGYKSNLGVSIQNPNDVSLEMIFIISKTFPKLETKLKANLLKTIRSKNHHLCIIINRSNHDQKWILTLHWSHTSIVHHFGSQVSSLSIQKKNRDPHSKKEQFWV